MAARPAVLPSSVPHSRVASSPRQYPWKERGSRPRLLQRRPGAERAGLLGAHPGPRPRALWWSLCSPVHRATNQGSKQSKREEAAPQVSTPSTGAANSLLGSGDGGPWARPGAAQRTLTEGTPQDGSEGACCSLVLSYHDGAVTGDPADLGRPTTPWATSASLHKHLGNVWQSRARAQDGGARRTPADCQWGA